MKDNVRNINVSGDYIYYIRDNSIERIRADGTEQKTLLTVPRSTDPSSITSRPISKLDIAGGWIYYMNQAEMDKLYRVRIDGTQNQAVE